MVLHKDCAINVYVHRIRNEARRVLDVTDDLIKHGRSSGHQVKHGRSSGPLIRPIGASVARARSEPSVARGRSSGQQPSINYGTRFRFRGRCTSCESDPGELRNPSPARSMAGSSAPSHYKAPSTISSMTGAKPCARGSITESAATNTVAPPQTQLP